VACYGFGLRQRWTQALTSVAFSMVVLDARAVTVGTRSDVPGFPDKASVLRGR
jgi:hypothetical protein